MLAFLWFLEVWFLEVLESLERSGRLVGKMSSYFHPDPTLMVPSCDQKIKKEVNV